MAFYDGLHSFKNVLKRQVKTAFKIYISIAIVLSPIFLMNSANASTVGGWNLSNPVAQGASTVYDATKNVLINGKDYVKDSWVKITPTVSQVSKVLARGTAAYALSVAVEQLIGSVDWVLDPANNQIKYTVIPDGSFGPIIYYINDQTLGWNSNNPFTSPTSAINSWISEKNNVSPYYNLNLENINPTDQNGTTVATLTYTTKSDPDSYKRQVSLIVRSMANPSEVEEEEKRLPLDVVAQQVISNANAGDVSAQVATTAAAADIVAEAETDNTKARPIANQAEANAETKPADAAAAESANEATAEAKPNEANPEATDISIQFPVFCGWAPLVCEAAQTVISFPQTLTNWWNTATNAISSAWSTFNDWVQEAKDYFKEEPTQHETEQPNIQDLSVSATEVNLNGSIVCPQDSVNFSLMGQSVTLDMPYQPLCNALDFFKPAVLVVGAISSVYIIAGVRTKEEDE